MAKRAEEVAETGSGSPKKWRAEDWVAGVGTNPSVVGVGAEGDASHFVPVPGMDGRRVAEISSFKHMLALLEGGVVLSCGENEYGETGRDSFLSVPRPIASLDALTVSCVAAGEGYSVIVSGGRVFSWGRNHVGQLGHGTRADVTKPKLVRGAVANKVIVQVACGRSHTLMLARTGELFGAGDGNIGNGDPIGSTQPSPIVHLYGSPINQILCGESHSMCLTKGGVVWMWGSNTFGQLGMGPDPAGTVFRPNVVRALEGARVVAGACGSHHSLVLTEEGRVLTWGKGADGQLGHGDTGREVAPRVVSELLGVRIVRAAGGRRHTVFIDDQGRTFVAGTSPLAPTTRRPVQAESVVGGATGVFCGPFATHFVYSSAPVHTDRTGVLYIGEEALRRVEMATEVSAATKAEFSELAETYFSFPGSVNGSFLAENYFACNGEDTMGIDLLRARQFMVKLVQLGAGEALANAWSRLIRNSLDAVSSKAPENLRVWVLAFLNPAMTRPHEYQPVIERVLVSLVGLRDRARRVVLGWLAHVPLEIFSIVCAVVQTYLAYVTSSHQLYHKGVTAAMVMGMLHDCRRRDLPPGYFYNSALSAQIDVVHEYALFRQGGKVFSYLNYPYLLDPPVKAALVAISFKEQMQQQFPTILAVRREHVLMDALSQIHSKTDYELRRQLKVVFVGENGLDEGGLTRELFHLLLQQIMDPQYGLFTMIQSSGKNWFSHGADGSAVLYELIGVLLGLAISNSVIVNVQFPLVLYAKLLGSSEARLEQLAQIDPDLAKGLRDLLAMESVDDLGLTFSVSRDVFGQAVSYDLLTNGANVPVTSANVRQYVELYSEFICNGEFATQFEALRRGFARVTGGSPVIPLLNATELQLLVEGKGGAEIRLLDLKPRTYYIGYTPDDPVVQNFWSVASELSQEEARRFLVFVTGSTGVPIQGLRALPFAIQKSGGPDRLPASHTCAGVLDLPAYETREQLKKKLLQALEEGQGFGLA